MTDTSSTPETSNDPGFPQWAVVEIRGHQTFAGMVSEQQLFGTTLLRIDVPETTGQGTTVPAYTKYFGAGSIYAVTPCSEETARIVARNTSSHALYVRSVAPALAAATVDDDDDDYDQDAEDAQDDALPGGRR